MNITKPSETSSLNLKVEEAVCKFEQELNDKEKDLSYYHLVIDGEYNRIVCDKIESLYSAAGWRKVECSTSIEKGERGGLTGLKLYKPDYCI